MVVQVTTNTGQVHYQVQLEGADVVGSADAGADQQHGRVVRTGTDDHLAGFDHLASDEFDTDRDAAAHEHPLHVRVATDRQVVAVARGVQVRKGGAHPPTVHRV